MVLLCWLGHENNFLALLKKKICLPMQRCKRQGLIPGWGRSFSRKWQSTRFLAWKIPWTEEPGGLQSTGLQRVGHDWVHTHTHAHTHMLWKDSSHLVNWHIHHVIHHTFIFFWWEHWHSTLLYNTVLIHQAIQYILIPYSSYSWKFILFTNLFLFLPRSWPQFSTLRFWFVFQDSTYNEI